MNPIDFFNQKKVEMVIDRKLVLMDTEINLVKGHSH